MADTHKSAREYIGNVLGGAVVGQMNYDWSFDVQPYYLPDLGVWTSFNFGYEDTTTFQNYSLNGAWGQWSTVPTEINLYQNALSAGNFMAIHALTGWNWNGIDDGLEQGTTGGSWAGLDYDTKIEKWNELLDTIDSTVSWIWGNIRDGGCGLLKYDTNSAFPIASYGTYSKEINGKMEYKIASTSGNAASLTSWNYNGALVVFCRNRKLYGSEICWTRGQNDDCYLNISPHSAYPLYWIYYDGVSNRPLSDSFDSTNAKFSLIGGSQVCPNTLVSMNSIYSPYSNLCPIYYPDHIIDDASWLLESFDDGIEEGPSLGGDDDPNNGDGDYNNSSDDIPSTSLDRFTVDAQDCGFVTVYKVPKETLKEFGAWLFSSHPQDFWDWIDEIKKIWDNPMDCIMSLNLCAFNANTGGDKDISFFGKSSGYTAPVVDGLTQIFDCGYLDNGDGCIHEYSGNFLDYGAKSTIKIFVPYCGTFSLATNEVQGARLHLQYVIDLLTGACVAELQVERDRSYVTEDPSLDSLLYRFNGNIFQQIPIGASSYGNILRGQLDLAGSAMSALTGNVAGAITGSLNSVLGMSPQVERVGNCGTSYGYMSTQMPFIIQEYPWYNWNDKYDEYYGRPLYSFKKLGDCDGYTEIDSNTLWANFKGITQEEEDMLKSILNNGGIYMEKNTAYTNYNP